MRRPLRADRSPLRRLGPLFFLALLCHSSAAGPPASAPDPVFRKDKVDRAVDRAVKYLLTQQDSQMGWISDKGKSRTVFTSLSVLSLAAAGHQANYPTPEGRAMKRAIQYVLRAENQDGEGFLGGTDKSQMYGHGITCLMLGEMLGQGVDEKMDALIVKRLEKGIALILDSQAIPKNQPSHQGGWRYQPTSKDADISCTVWQIMALRSARNAGLEVPSKAIERALDYIRRCYCSAVDARGNPLNMNSGFGYMPGGSSASANTCLTAMGLLSLQLAGDFESPFVRGSTTWIENNPPAWGQTWFIYGSYYYAQAMYQRGGRHAEKGAKIMRDLFLPEQRTDGSWEGVGSREAGIGKVFTTSCAILTLSVKYHYLPIYQR